MKCVNFPAFPCLWELEIKYEIQGIPTLSYCYIFAILFTFTRVTQRVMDSAMLGVSFRDLVRRGDP